jgi:hypothetical protein
MNKAQHKQEAEALADAVLKASGSALKHYSMQHTRQAIFNAAQAGIDKARAELLAEAEWAYDVLLNQCGLAPDCEGMEALKSAIAKARGQA